MTKHQTSLLQHCNQTLLSNFIASAPSSGWRKSWYIPPFPLSKKSPSCPNALYIRTSYVEAHRSLNVVMVTHQCLHSDAGFFTFRSGDEGNAAISCLSVCSCDVERWRSSEEGGSGKKVRRRPLVRRPAPSGCGAPDARLTARALVIRIRGVSLMLSGKWQIRPDRPRLIRSPFPLPCINVP